MRSDESRKPWQVATHAEWVRDELVPYVSIDNGLLYADFSERAAWTIRKIEYGGDRLVLDYWGAWNGSVCNVPKSVPVAGDPGWSGTGHGDEKIISLHIQADGTKHPYAPGMTCEGREIRVIKRSTMQRLAHVAEIIFPATGDQIIEKHHYQAISDLDGGFNFLYAFMHCNAKSMTEWLAGLDEANQQEEEGITGQPGRRPVTDGHPVSLEKDVKSLAFYSRILQKGLVYVYPRVYEGEGTFRHSIYDRPSDVKLYFRPAMDPKSRAGSSWRYEVKLIPFAADPDHWKAVARERRTWDAFPA